MIRSTHTYAILDVSPAAYREIEGKLRDAGYEHLLNDDGEGHTVIDMHGLALRVDPDVEEKPHAHAYELVGSRKVGSSLGWCRQPVYRCACGDEQPKRA